MPHYTFCCPFCCYLRNHRHAPQDCDEFCCSSSYFLPVPISNTFFATGFAGNFGQPFCSTLSVKMTLSDSFPQICKLRFRPHRFQPQSALHISKNYLSPCTPFNQATQSKTNIPSWPSTLVKTKVLQCKSITIMIVASPCAPAIQL